MLGELVDFTDGTDDDTRAAIEAAMEASGLLTAEVHPDGAIVLAEGTLLAAPTVAANDPLSRYLSVIDRSDGNVARVLDSVSTDPTDLGGQNRTVVTVDGRFRIGVLTGRHRKPRAEHIGLSARRARLERQRSEARLQLAAAQESLERIQALLAAALSGLAAALSGLAAARLLRDELPSHDPVSRALLAIDVAQEAADAARAMAAERERERRRAEEEHAEAVDKSRRVAANLGLGADEESLRAAERSLNLADQAANRAAGALKELQRSVGYWRQAAERWARARDDATTGAEQLRQAQAEHEPVAAGLAAIEEKVGAAYTEILAAIEARESQLAQTSEDLGRAREAQLEINTQLVEARRDAADREREAAEEQRRCLGLIPDMRGVLAVPGLLASATADAAPLQAPVEESIAGVRRLAEAVGACVPAAGAREVTADGVRQSLRQRRDSLGAG